MNMMLTNVLYQAKHVVFVIDFPNKKKLKATIGAVSGMNNHKEHKMIKKSFKLSLKVKDTQHVFGEGFEPGVLMTKVIEFELEPEKYKSNRFAYSLMNMQDDFIEENIEVAIEEIKDDGK